MADIYAIGDGAYLTEVINSLALLTQSSSFIGLTMVGFTMGVLWTGIQSIMSGGKEFKIQNILIAALVWMAMFGATTEVIVQDVKTSNTRVVSNVPYGIAMTGQIVSSIGYHLTERFEQAFSTTSMLEYGYAKKFTVIRALDTLDDLGAADSDTAGNGKRILTIETYLAKCTLKGIDTPALSAKEIAESGDLLEAIKLDNPALFVEVYLPGLPQPNDGFTMSCAAAHDAIKNDLLSGTFPAQLFEHLKTVLDHPDPEDLLQKVYEEDLIFGAVGTPVINILINAIIKNRFPAAIEMKAANESSSNYYSEMIKQATDQRNDQWMAQHDMFTKTAPILMTFFESLMYAVAPFLAFILALGPAGFGFAAQYIKMALWIQLWSPVMAIIYFFTNFAFTAKMDSLVNASQVDPFSIQGQAYVATSAADWLATGAMLVAATPFITLMLIYGGAQAATTLTRQVQGQDHINEKITSRDRIQPSPMQVDSGNQLRINDAVLGHGSPGSNAIQPKIGTSSMRSHMMSSASTQQVAAQNSAVNDVSKMAGVDYGTVYQISQTHSHGSSTTAAKSNVDNVLEKASKNITDSVSQGSEVSSAFQSRMAVVGSMTAGGKGTTSNTNNLAQALGDESAENIAQKYNIQDPGTKKQLSNIMVDGHKSRLNGDKGGVSRAMGKVGNILSMSGVDISASGSASLASIGNDAEKLNTSTSSAFNQEIGANSSFGRSLNQAIKDDLMQSDGKTNSNIYKQANAEKWNKASSKLASSAESFQNTNARNNSLSMKQEMGAQEFATALIGNNADQGLRDFVSGTPELNQQMNNETNRLKNSPAYKNLNTSQGSAVNRQLSTQAAARTLATAIDTGFFNQPGNTDKLPIALEVMSGSMAIAMGAPTHGYNPNAYTANAGLQTPTQAQGNATAAKVESNTHDSGDFAMVQPADEFQNKFVELTATNAQASSAPNDFYNAQGSELQNKASTGYAAIDAQAANKISPQIQGNTALHNVSKHGMGLIEDAGGAIEGFANNFTYGMSDAAKTEAVRGRGMEAYAENQAADMSDNYAAAAAFISTGHLMEQYQPEGYEPTFANSPMEFANSVINTNFANEKDEAITKNLLGVGTSQPGVSKAASENHYEQFKAAVRTDDTTRLSALSKLSPEPNHEEQQAFKNVIKN